MKKLTITVLCLLALSARSETPVQISLGIGVDVSKIEFKGLSYSPAAVVTNSSTEWVSVTEVRTNFYFGMQPDEVVTNAVQKQIVTPTTTLHLAYWTTSFDYSIPAGSPLIIGNALSATPIRRADMTVQMVITPTQLTAILGSQLYAQTLSAAQLFGTLPVSGSIQSGLQAAVQSVLAGVAQ